MAAAHFEFVSLAEKARQALDGIHHALTASVLLLDEPFAVIIRHSYGLAAFYRAFQPLNVLPIDVEPHTIIALQTLHARRGDDHDSKQAEDGGEGWDDWQWDEKGGEAAAAVSSSVSALSSTATVSPTVTLLISGYITPSVVSHIASVVTSLRSSAAFTTSLLYVYSALSSQSHEAAGLSSFAAIKSQLPPSSSVQHLPLVYSLLLPSVFFLPSVSSLPFSAVGQAAADTAADVLPSLSSLSSLVKGRSVEDGKKPKQPITGSTSIPAAPSSAAASSVPSISAALTSMLTHLRLRPAVYSSGRVGHEVGQRVKEAVARHWHNISGGEGRGSSRKGKASSSSSSSSIMTEQQQQAWQAASVVLVDRMHDMAAVCAHTAHVLDHVYHTERRRSETVSSPSLSTSTLYAAVNALHHSGDKDCSMLLNALVSESLPAALRIASRLLVAALPAVPSQGRQKGEASVAKLKEQVRQMEADPGSLCAHHGLYEMTSALVRAEDDEGEGDGANRVSNWWRQLQSLERVCLSSLPSGEAASSDSPLAPLIDLLQSPSTAALSLPLLPLLSLAAFQFSALGDLPLPATDERQFRDALLHRVQADRAHDELVARLLGSDGDADSFVEHSMTLLQQMRYARATFSSSQLSGSLVVSNADEPRVEPFVARLLSLCLDPAQSAADLEQHHSTTTELSTFDQLRLGAKESLKAAAALSSRASDSAAAVSSFLSLGSSVVNKVTSSLSSSMAGGGSSAPSHPSHHSTLVFFVLGDVSWLEVSAMLRVAALHPQCNVLIGCTGVADAEEMAWKTFASPAAAAAAAAHR